jgi:O-antigen/teichoic acid export membrane protein
MMKQRQILKNALMSILQVALVGISLFVLYRFLLRAIGVEKLGIWSVVLATTSFANVANLGISASAVRFVAKYLARGEEEKVLILIQTSVISIGAFMGCGLAAAYPFAKWILGLVIPVAHLKLAISILPYALLSLWITIIASVFQAGLDGYQRIDRRNFLLIGGALFFLFLCFVAVPAYGLMGIAYAQVINSMVLLVGSWLMLRHHLVRLPFFPTRWSRELFREIVGYSIKFQVISVFSMLYDPITKSLLAKFGGLSMAGYYDMASRMILQFRSLIVSANQVLVPAVADLYENNPDYIQEIYRESYRLMIFISIPLYSIVIALAPIISEIWIGRYETLFVLCSAMLAVGWFINSVTVPAYFIYLGTGDLFWNVISHLIIGILNVVVGFLLGAIYGGIGVVTAWVLSLIIGSCIISISYHYKNRLSYADLFPKEDLGILVGSLAGLFISIAI